ncbi:hypothetical protein VL20_2338 [Microcystis panniformis FACHB-1757]|uniref:Uncharacterized protein n=1 Tax=Microcystis panniformis FACHB-1757 TaxID=1638788 RepID=A0A0K1RZV9_9CHRO|nr:hypothetical protein VL20_2338 [Microcystis panniformis FACHB-1757]
MGNTEFGLCLTLSFISNQYSVISYQLLNAKGKGSKKESGKSPT